MHRDLYKTDHQQHGELPLSFVLTSLSYDSSNPLHFAETYPYQGKVNYDQFDQRNNVSITCYKVELNFNRLRILIYTGAIKIRCEQKARLEDTMVL